MGCLFDCFRSRDKEPTCDSLSKPSPVKPDRSHDSKNRLSALFLSEEKTASSHCHDREGSGLDSMHIDKDHNDEAHFLKASDTVSTTPIEFGKASKKLESTPVGKHFGSPQTHFSISSNSDAVLQLGEKIDESCEEIRRSLVTSEQTPSSCLTDARYSARISFGSSDGGEESQESVGTAFRDEVDRTRKVPPKAGNITRETKSVQSEFDFDQSYSSSSSTKSSSRKPEMAGKNVGTPLKLADEIQTAGTIFPKNMDSVVRGRPRIRSEFVHSASNLIENASISKLLKDSDESVKQDKLQAGKEKTENKSPTSIASGGKSSDENDQIRETSSSTWVDHGKENSNISITHGDRPIIGMVAAHWNDKEQAEISPKWWDGNGIPNSTNKYKEDQKVSWHATPFEERLEKALSEEAGQGFIPMRKLGIVEESERDTAVSHLQHSTQSMSVISF